MQIVNVHVDVVIIFCAPAVQIPRLKLFAENNYVFTVHSLLFVFPLPNNFFLLG